jgi:dihydrofolate reductase
MMGKLKLNITMSVDGFVAGPDQSPEHPLGVGGEELHDWLVPLKAFRESHGEEGGEDNASTPFAEEILGGAGATIMGRNMFGGGPGPWDESWKGWWGDNPPYHHPVFVLTRHPREPLEMHGGTTFHFVTDGIESALEHCRLRELAPLGNAVERGSVAAFITHVLAALTAAAVGGTAFARDGSGLRVPPPHFVAQLFGRRRHRCQTPFKSATRASLSTASGLSVKYAHLPRCSRSTRPASSSRFM